VSCTGGLQAFLGAEQCGEVCGVALAMSRQRPSPPRWSDGLRCHGAGTAKQPRRAAASHWAHCFKPSSAGTRGWIERNGKRSSKAASLLRFDRDYTGDGMDTDACAQFAWEPMCWWEPA